MTLILATRTYGDNTAPEYYINDQGACVIGPTTNCPPGECTCKRIISGQSGPKQMYDGRTSAGVCVICLQEQL